MACGKTADEDHPAIRRASEVLAAGGLVAFPTETVYGLGGDATCAAAVDAIYAAKGRPADNPLIVHLAGAERLTDLVTVPPVALRLAERFWPGPLTLVLPARKGLPGSLTRGLNTLAVRVPDHPVALALLRRSGLPVAAPSANRSGRPSPTTAEHVLQDLDGRLKLILDGGPCREGIESTVLDLSRDRPTLLRPGAIRREQLQEALGRTVRVPGVSEHSSPASPGTRYRHYTPQARVVLVDRDVSDTSIHGMIEHLTQLGSWAYLSVRRSTLVPPGVRVVHRQSASELTRCLFADLREFDRHGVKLILVDAVDDEEPVMDRLRRASSDRLSQEDFINLRLPEIVQRLRS